MKGLSSFTCAFMHCLESRAAVKCSVNHAGCLEEWYWTYFIYLLSCHLCAFDYTMTLSTCPTSLYHIHWINVKYAVHPKCVSVYAEHKRAKFCKSIQLGDYSTMKTEEDTTIRRHWISFFEDENICLYKCKW